MKFPNITTLFGGASGQPSPTLEAGAGNAAPAPVPAPIVNPDPTANHAIPVAGTPADAIPGVIPGTEATDKSPLDQFTKMWDTVPTEAKPGEDIFNIDPTKLQEAVSGLNFASSIPQELMAKALAGDATALQNVINTASQSAFSQSLQVNAKLVQRALEQQQTKVDAKVAEQIKLTTANTALRAENPAFSHPAAKPIIESLERQLAVTYPKATAAELAQAARAYLTNFASQINGAPKASAEDLAAKEGEAVWDLGLWGGNR